MMLAETVSKGGNLLLNVGPTARGTFDGRALERLQGIGRWMETNGRSIYGCTQAPAEFGRPAGTLLTYNPEAGRIYVHVLEWPLGVLALDGFAGRVEYAQLLHDASEVAFSEKGGETGFMPGSRGKEAENTLTLRLPVLKPDVEVPVVELFLKRGR
jgi:alpha-L-fucosidase